MHPGVTPEFQLRMALTLDFLSFKNVPNCNFSLASFREEVSFAGSTFCEAALFDRATFLKGASFADAKFYKHSWFREATFGSGSLFVGTKFHNEARFQKATFGETIRFDEAIFKESAIFNEATFGDGISFERTTFLGFAGFRGVTVEGSLVFSGVPGDTSRRVFLPRNDPRSKAINFEWLKLEQPERILFHSLNLENVSFLYADVSEIRFIDVSWPKEGRWNIHFPGRVEVEPTIHFERSGKAELEWIERTCQQLKRNYEERRIYGEAGDFHWAELDTRRERLWMECKETWNQATGWRTVTRLIWPHGMGEPLLLWLYRTFTGYGERMLRSFLWLVVFILLLGSLHAFFGLRHTPPDSPKSLLTLQCATKGRSSIPIRCSLYPVLFHGIRFAVQDSTFQRTNEYIPASRGARVLSFFGRIVIPVQITLLLVAIRRRFRR